MTGDGYLLDNQQAEAGRRFDALSAIFDPWTFRHIDDLGISPGWRQPLPAAPRSAGMTSPPTSRRLSFSTWFMPGWYWCT